MFLGLKDFDIDIFLRLDDENIYLYYDDMETLPQIANYLPLGSFDEEGKLKFKTIDMENRIKIGMEFLHRDGYAEYEELSMRSLIRVDRFMEQFSNIPEVEEFFDKYIERCETSTPPEWCTSCKDGDQLQEDCPSYYDPDFDTCAIKVPTDEFLGVAGDPILRFDANIPTEIFLENSSNIVTASIQVRDSDGTVVTASDSETYNILPTSNISTTPYITVENDSITTNHRPTFSGETYGIKSPLTLELISSITKNYIINFDDTTTISNWEFEIPTADFLPDGDYVVKVTGELKTSTDTEGITSTIKIITPNIIINPIGVINNTKPVFSGEAFGITGSLTIFIDGQEHKYEEIPIINNFWRFECPIELIDGTHTLEVSGEWNYSPHDFGSTSATQTFGIDTTATLDLFPPSSGFINEYEYHSDLLINGITEDIESGRPITISLNGYDYETIIENNSFEVVVPRERVEKLVDGTHYLVEARTSDLLGNQAKDTEVILIDLQRPVPNIDLEEIQDINPNTESILITGLVSGDARAGDLVTITVGSYTYDALVYKDTKYPIGDYNLEIDYSELYYIIILYFNGIYRTNPDYAQNFGTYNILTDINFDLNYYSLIIDIKEFFTKEFIYFLKTMPGSLPFANDFGTEIKLAVQTKNYIVQQLEIEAEINFFIRNFNALYGDLVYVKDIIIKNQESDIGADSWLIEVFANIQQDRLIYRLEI